MTRQDIEKKVTDILVDKLGVEPEEVKSEADFREDLGGDSLDLVMVIMEIEKDFSISVTDEEADQVNTVADIFDLVEKHVRK
jgi:acyl carrier protein